MQGMSSKNVSRSLPRSVSDSELSTNSFWRHQRKLTDKEKNTLEDKWNHRHHKHPSQLNDKTCFGLRDYFDRPRELESDSRPGLKAQVRWKPGWRLDSEEDPAVMAKERRELEFSRAASGANLDRPSISAVPPTLNQREHWSQRHHVTHSVANRCFHEHDREYFGRFVDPRSHMVVPNRVKGITRHYLPHKHPVNPDGSDDGPSNAEVLMGDNAALPALLAPLPPAVMRMAPGRPDGSFDHWGE